MRICLILEGSYPYTFGGVSSWTHNYIKALPQHEFVLWVIGAKASDKGRFKYELPDNVKDVHEVFLDDALLIKPRKKDKFKLTEEERETIKHFIDCNKPDWNILFDMFQVKRYNPASFLMSDDFLDILTELCKEKYPYVAFADIFYTIRSMLIPVLHVIQSEVPQAQIYHTVCTGYGGLLAALANFVTGKKVILTEHGIYSREREEEIIRARWVVPEFKRHWIRFFYMLSDAIYGRATFITCLFGNASKIQQELGADPDRCRVIPNGIHYDNFCDIPLKEDDGIVDIAAVIRLAPIKDVKTLIYAFNELKSMRKNVRLHILGGTDDDEYAKECYDLVKTLGLSDVMFVGQVNVIEYMAKIDFTILTSISEGQPLCVLESFAARRPAVTTDVGCCRQLIEGEADDVYGTAGYCVPPMHREALAIAMDKMCASRQEREEMGMVGQKRVERFFKHKDMMKKYSSLYREA
jgi:glycosyltransferase involved in cell wall biosynthesis